MSGFNKGRAYNGSPPRTPRRTQRTSQVNELVIQLNHEFAGLMLRTRTALESPSSPHRMALREVCYDRLIFAFYKHREALGRCLEHFKVLAAGADRSTHVSLLIDCLPSSAKTRDPPANANSSFTQRLRDACARPKTPELDEGTEVMAAPSSPSSRQRSGHNPSGRTKRLFAYKDDRVSPKLPKNASSNDKFCFTSQAPPPTTTKSTSSFDSETTTAMPSFTSTNLGLDGTDEKAIESFDTEMTAPDAVNSLSQTQFPSTFSLTSSIFQQMDGMPASNDRGRNQGSTSSFKARLARCDEWRASLEGEPQTSATSVNKTSEASRRLGYDEGEDANPLSPLSQRLHDSHLSEKRHVETKSITRTESGECTQVQDLPRHGMFEIIEAGNFASSESLPDLEIRVLWEMQRWSSAAGIALIPFIRGFGGAIPDAHEYDALLDSLRARVAERGDAITPALASHEAWHLHAQDCTQYEARLAFASSSQDPYLFRMTFRPLSIDKSCRIQRRYGAHRTLYLDVPSFSRAPKYVGDKTVLKDQFTEWLCTPKNFLGRTWRAIQFEQNKVPKEDVDRYLGYRAVFLAMEGPGLTPLTIKQVLDDHMNLDSKQSENAPFRKLFSRLDLGFSKTDFGLTFRPSQVVWRRDDTDFEDDRFAENGDNMTDGCGIISVGAMKALCNALGVTGSLPSSVQGRLGGAKGVWVRSGDVFSTKERDTDVRIWIRPSQMKFPPPEADTDSHFDLHRWSLEVSSMSGSDDHEKQMGSLHLSMIPLLVDRGVSVENIEAVMTEAVAGKKVEIEAVLNDRVKSRQWLKSQNTTAEEMTQDGDDARLPSSFKGRAKVMLERGFAPKESPYLADLMKDIAQAEFTKTAEKLNAKIWSSVHLMGVADPLGVLEPDTIHVGFSQCFDDPVKGEGTNQLDGLMGLLTRFPMQINSDIHKVKIVYKPELAYLKDRIVFPLRGRFSIPAKLQGGDLDGDLYYLFWDRRLVDDFKNISMPKPSNTLEDLGVEKDTRTLKDVLQGVDAYQNFLREGFRARLDRVPLGQVANDLSRTAYHLWPWPYRHPVVIAFFECHTALIDADKQGHKLSEIEYDRFKQKQLKRDPRLKNFGRTQYEETMARGIQPGMTFTKYPYTHPVDHLLCNVIHPSMVLVLDTMVAFRNVNAIYCDEELMQPSIDASSLARYDKVLQEVQRTLYKDLELLRKDWGDAHTKNGDKNKVQDIIDTFRHRYKQLQPKVPGVPQAPPLDISTMRRYKQEPSSWDLLKASSLYSQFYKLQNQSIIYHLAGVDLGYIKVQHKKHALVTTDIMSEMKMKKLADPKSILPSGAGVWDRANNLWGQIGVAHERTGQRDDTEMRDAN